MKLVILAFAALTVAAHAQKRTSAAYSIATDITDTGGRRTTGGVYTNDGSMGGISGLAAVAAPAETAKQGYTGQLYDVLALEVTAPAANVNETATLQLGTRQLLDDGTNLALAASSVTWGVVAGPVASITSAGLATAAAVYQNTGATVQGTFVGQSDTLGLTVVNTSADNFGLYAGDGVEDDWQVLYFGENNPQGLALADPDGDLHTNSFEFVAGLIPNVATSRFNIRLEAVPGQPNQKRIIFSPIVAGRTYRVFNGGAVINIQTPMDGAPQSDAGGERTVTDTSATDQSRFYNVEITK